jgi:hypothetical protein
MVLTKQIVVNKKSRLKAYVLLPLGLVALVVLFLLYWHFFSQRISFWSHTTSQPPLFPSKQMSVEEAQLRQLNFLDIDKTSTQYSDDSCSDTNKGGVLSSCVHTIMASFRYNLSSIPTDRIKSSGWTLESSGPETDGTTGTIQSYKKTSNGVSMELDIDNSGLEIDWSGNYNNDDNPF